MNQILKMCFLIAAGLMTALPLFAQGPDTYWAPQGGSTDFCTAGNWDNGAGDNYRFHIDAGTPDADIDSDVPWTIGFFNPSGGTVNLNSGNMSVSNYMYVNDGGTFNMSGGFFSMVENDPLSIGRDWNSGGPSAGTLNVSGGLFQPGALAWGGAYNNNSMVVPYPDGSTGTVSVSETGTIDTQTGYIHLGEGGVINVGGGGGGILRTWAVLGGDLDGVGGGNGTINFDGGTLVCTNATHFVITHVTANLLAGGATIDTAGGFDFLDIPAVLQGDGGLTKKGNGTLTLVAPNTYAGPTVIESGTLALGQHVFSWTTGGEIASSSEIDVQAPATLDVTAVTGGIWTLGGTQTLEGNGTVVGAVVAAAGSRIEPGESIGTLTVTGDLTVGGSLDVEYDGAATQPIDMLAVSGVLDLNGGTIDFELDTGGSPLMAAAYVFASYGTLAPFTTPPVEQNVPAPYHVDYAYGPGGNQIALVIPEPSTLVLLAMGLLGAAVCLRRRR
jgi:autotransporter-associated beta strand protein